MAAAIPFEIPSGYLKEQYKILAAKLSELIREAGYEQTQFDKIGEQIVADILANPVLEALINQVRENIGNINIHGDKDGYTLLHYAVMSLKREPFRELMVKLLLGHGANIDEVTHNNETPLLRAVIGNRENQHIDETVIAAYDKSTIEIVKILSYFGSDLNIQDCLGRTALHYAIHDKLFDLGIELIRGGARVDLVDNFQEIPSDCAREIAALLDLSKPKGMTY